MRQPRFLAALILAVCPSTGAAAAQFSLLHSFGGSPTDGAWPERGVVLVGSTLYGPTSRGGTSDKGTVFKANIDGSGLQVLHNFGDGVGDAVSPSGSLTIAGSTIYGTAAGDNANLAVFRMNVDGSGYQRLITFTERYGGGGGVTLDGSTIYGTTGPNGHGTSYGTVFKMNTDGTGYQLLREFLPGSNDSVVPFGLTLVGTTLYGIATGGGGGEGAIFRLNTDGSGYEVLHTFAGGTSDGGFPRAGLTLSGSTLYGTTNDHGPFSRGTVFAIGVDGTSYRTVHAFASGEGSGSRSGITVNGSMLYGSTSTRVFQMNADGTGFQVLHTFVGGADDGNEAFGNLTLSGSTLYGTTQHGGASDNGILYSISVPEPPSVALLVIGGLGLTVVARVRRRRKPHARAT